jgi:hypothetical protein
MVAALFAQRGDVRVLQANHMAIRRAFGAGGVAALERADDLEVLLARGDEDGGIDRGDAAEALHVRLELLEVRFEQGKLRGPEDARVELAVELAEPLAPSLMVVVLDEDLLRELGLRVALRLEHRAG